MITNCYFCGKKTVSDGFNIGKVIFTHLQCDSCGIIFSFDTEYLYAISTVDDSVNTYLYLETKEDKHGYSTYQNHLDKIVLPEYFLCDLDNLKLLDMIKVFS